MKLIGNMLSFIDVNSLSFEPAFYRGRRGGREVIPKQKAFYVWRKKFEKKPDWEKALFVLDAIVDNAPVPYDFESPIYKNLLKYILTACFNAKNFLEFEVASPKILREFKGAKKDLSDKRHSPIKAVKELRSFIDNYPRVANEVMVHAVFKLHEDNISINTNVGETEAADRLLRKILDAHEYGFKQIKKPDYLSYYAQAGCFQFQKPAKQRNFNLAIDGLIFELAYIIRKFVSNPELFERLDPPEGLPVNILGRKKGKFIFGHSNFSLSQTTDMAMPNTPVKKMNEFIALTVNALFDKSLDADKIKTRMGLLKEGAKLIMWD